MKKVPSIRIVLKRAVFGWATISPELSITEIGVVASSNLTKHENLHMLDTSYYSNLHTYIINYTRE